MKRGILLTLTLLLANLTLLQAQGGINFERGTLDAARKKARVEHKLIFIDAYASWCGPCKAMNRDVFPDQSVGALFNANFINLKIDMEKGNGPDVARGYKVNAYPTLLFLDEDGKVVHRVEGYRDAAGMIKEGKKALRSAPQRPPVVVNPTPHPAPVITNLPPERGIDFAHTSLAAAKAQALAENRLIFIDAFATWCGPCKAMARDVFTHPTAGDFFNANFINLKIDMEKGEGPSIAQAYNVSAYPTLLFIDGHGNVVTEEKGYRDVEGLVTLGQKALNARPPVHVPVNPNPVVVDPIVPGGTGCVTTQRQVLLGRMQKAKRLGNWCAYACAAEDYVEITPHAPWETLNDIAWDFYLNVDNREHLRSGVRMARKSVQMNRNYYNLDTQAMLLWKLGRTEKAIWKAEEAIQAAEWAGINAYETRMALCQMRGG